MPHCTRRFLGCRDKECSLCNNNPNKRCAHDDSFDECYANDQVMKSKCEADVVLELVSSSTGQRHNTSEVEVQVGMGIRVYQGRMHRARAKKTCLLHGGHACCQGPARRLNTCFAAGLGH